MANLGKLKQGPSSYPKFEPDFEAFPKPEGNVSDEDELTQESAPQTTTKGTIGSADEETEKKEDEDEAGATFQTAEEDEVEGDDSDLYYGEDEQELADQMSNRANNAAIIEAQKTFSTARNEASIQREKSKYTMGDVMFIVLAIIKDIIEIVGTVALGLGIFVGPMISFVITVAYFIARIAKGGSMTKNLTRSTFIWALDFLPVFPVYSIAMILTIKKERGTAKLKAEQHELMMKQAEQTINQLQRR